jgi:hypothetical protein
MAPKEAFFYDQPSVQKDLGSKHAFNANKILMHYALTYRFYVLALVK